MKQLINKNVYQGYNVLYNYFIEYDSFIKSLGLFRFFSFFSIRYIRSHYKYLEDDVVNQL